MLCPLTAPPGGRAELTLLAPPSYSSCRHCKALICFGRGFYTSPRCITVCACVGDRAAGVCGRGCVGFLVACHQFGGS